jgi:hypothetical protein
MVAVIDPPGARPSRLIPHSSEYPDLGIYHSVAKKCAEWSEKCKGRLNKSAMTSQNFHLAVVQLSTHPSFEVNGTDQMSEPIPLNEPSLKGFKHLLRPTKDEKPFLDALEECQAHCRNEYIEWARVRLTGILEWLMRQKRCPDLVALPEGSIPFELLSLIQDFVRASGTAVVAGTHRYSESRDQDYLNLGISECDLAPFRSGALFSMMPIFDADRVRIRGKLQLAPGEFLTALHEETSSLAPEPLEIQTPSGPLTILPLICSEATRRTAITHKQTDVAVICSYQPPTDYDYFEGTKRIFTQNQIPVLYVNDGKYGGSEIGTIWADTPAGWFRHSGPLKGKLPPGDAVLIVQTRPGDSAIQKGVADPRQATTLVKLSSIVSEIPLDPNYHAAKLLAEIADCSASSVQERSAQRKELLNQLQTLIEHCSPLMTRKIARVSEVLKGMPAPEILAVHCDDCTTSNKMDLRGLERGLCRFILPKLEDIKPSVELQRKSKEIQNNAAWYHLLLCTALREFGKDFSHSHFPNLALRELARNTKEAGDRAMLFLNHILGRILERFQGSSCILELETESGTQPLVAHNMSLSSFRSHHQSAASQDKLTPVLDNDFREDARITTSRGSRSMIVVPLLHPATNTIIAHVRLWANERNAFSPIEVNELANACHELVPDLLIVVSIRASAHHGWHPSVHGWDTHSLFNGLCFRLATVGRQHTVCPDISITIWHYDWAEQKIYARGTAQFDYEYESERALPFESFTGNQRTCTQIEVRKGDPRAVFKRHLKATRMELVGVQSVPLFKGLTPHERPIGCLNAYAFKKEQEGESASEPSKAIKDDEMVQLSRIVGRLIGDFLLVRSVTAQALLRYRLSEESLLGYNGFQVLLQSVLEMLSSEAGSIFALEGSRLHGVASTGLTTEDGYLVPHSECYYDLAISDEDKMGFTYFLASNPGKTLRRNEVNNPGAGTHDMAPSNRFREYFSLSEADHRRYLGYSIADVDGSLLGVIRVLRRASSRPFVESDEQLLKILATEARQVFVLYRDLATKAPLLSHPDLAARQIGLPWSGTAVVPQTVKLAAARILRPALHYEKWNRFEVRAILQDLNVVFKAEGSVVTKLGFEKFTSTGEIYVQHNDMHMHHTNEQPVEEDYPYLVPSKDSVSLKCLREMRPVFYWRSSSLYRPFHSLDGDVKCGVCIPFALQHCSWPDQRPQRGVLSVEFNDFLQLTSAHFDVLFCAIIKLTRVGIWNSAFEDSIALYADITDMKSFLEACKNEAAKLGIEFDIDFNQPLEFRSEDIDLRRSLWVGSHCVGALQMRGPQEICDNFGNRVLCAWSVFLNCTTGTSQPWKVQVYGSEMADDLQPLSTKLGWVGAERGACS